MLGIPGFQREKNLLQRLGKKKVRKLIWTKQRVRVLFKLARFLVNAMSVSSVIVRTFSECSTTGGLILSH